MVEFYVFVPIPISPLAWKVSGPPRKRVGLPAGLARPIDDPEVESREEFGPLRLTAAKQLGGHKVLQVFVIREDLNRM